MIGCLLLALLAWRFAFQIDEGLASLPRAGTSAWHESIFLRTLVLSLNKGTSMHGFVPPHESCVS